MQRTSFIALGLATVLVLTSAACSKTDTGAPVVAESSKSSTTTTGSGSDSGNDSNGNTESSVKDQVSQAKQLDQVAGTGSCIQAYTAWGTALAEMSTIASPTATQDDIDKAKAAVDEARKSVPDEIKSDFDVWAQTYTDYITKLQELEKNGGVATPDNLAKFEELSKTIDTPEFKKANDNITAYFDKTCKTK